MLAVNCVNQNNLGTKRGNVAFGTSFTPEAKTSIEKTFRGTTLEKILEKMHYLEKDQIDITIDIMEDAQLGKLPTKTFIAYFTNHKGTKVTLFDPIANSAHASNFAKNFLGINMHQIRNNLEDFMKRCEIRRLRV